MRILYCLLLVGLLLIPGVAAHGDSQSVDENQEADEDHEGLTLEEIVTITALIAITFLVILAYIVQLKDKKFLVIMVITALSFLTLDYLYFKYYYYA